MSDTTPTMNAPIKTETKFQSEAVALRAWKSVKPLAGHRIVRNEVEYLKDGTFVLVTVQAAPLSINAWYDGFMKAVAPAGK